MLYTPKQTSVATGASPSTIRNYVSNYARYFSTEATTTPRKFTDDDLRLIAFILDRTKAQGLNHSEVALALQDGGLADFVWDPPEEDPTMETETPHSAGSGGSGGSGGIVPLATLQAAQMLLHDAQAREQAAIDREAALQARVEALTLKLGEATGKLAAIQDKRPAWFKRIFGG